MKLSLSTAALERLLGGDTELEIELRHQVAKQFVKQHFTDLFKQEAFTETINLLRKAVTSAIQEQVGSVAAGSHWDTQLKPDVAERVRRLIDSLAETKLNEAIDRVVANQITYYERNWAKYIDKKVKEKFDQAIEAHIQAQFQERLAKAVDALAGRS
jgi:hypothetical protein